MDFGRILLEETLFRPCHIKSRYPLASILKNGFFCVDVGLIAPLSTNELL